MTPADAGDGSASDGAPAQALVPAELALTDPAEPSAAPAPHPADGPGLFTFSLDGRAAPAVFVAGWAGVILGGALAFVSLMGATPAVRPWLFLGGLVLIDGGLICLAGSQAIERGRQPSLAYRGPAPVLVLLAVVAVTLSLLLAVLAPMSALGLDAGSPLATTINLTLQTLTYVALVRLLVVGTGSLRWDEMRVVRPDAGAVRDLFLGAVIALPTLLVTLVLAAVLSRFLAPAGSPLPAATSLGGWLLNLLSAAVIAPIGEELFFRGFATTAWARSVGPRAAIVRGALLFAIVHVVTVSGATFEEGLQHAAFAFLGLLPVAITLGWLFLSRRSLYAAIGLHAAFNGIQLLLLAAATGLT